MEFVQESSEKENIWIASSDGDLARVMELLQEGVSVNAQDEMGYSPLHAAASYGHVELVQYLVSQGADLSIRDLDGDTPLLVAEEANVFEVLLSLGADVSARNNDGFGIIEKVLDDENYDFLNYLLMAGHVPEASDLFQKVQIALKEVEQPEDYDGEYHPEGIEEGDEDEEEDDDDEMTA